MSTRPHHMAHKPRAGAVPLGLGALLLALAVIALGTCGGDDDDQRRQRLAR